MIWDRMNLADVIIHTISMTTYDDETESDKIYHAN